MAIDEIHYRNWRIAMLTDESSWKALACRPSSPLHEATVPHGPDRRAVMADAKTLINRNQEP